MFAGNAIGQMSKVMSHVQLDVVNSVVFNSSNYENLGQEFIDSVKIC